MWRWSPCTSTAAECLHLLSSARFGHLGMCAGERPQVLPVNYAVLDGDGAFRTGVNTVLASGTDDRTVAFEADEIDDLMESGWSVQVVGRARPSTTRPRWPTSSSDCLTRKRRGRAHWWCGSRRRRSPAAGSPRTDPPGPRPSSESYRAPSAAECGVGGHLERPR